MNLTRFLACSSILLAASAAVGNTPPSDSDSATELRQMAERREDPNLLFDYAYTLFKGGGGIAPDPQAARKLYEQLSASGHASAAYNAGLMLIKGQGGAIDLDAAFTHFLRAMALGHSQAMPHLGIVRLRQGRPEEAVLFLDKIPEDGDLWYNMFRGDAYRQLPPTERNRRLALESYSAASDLGVAKAHFDVAATYADGDVGIEPDPIKALAYLSRAVKSDAHDGWGRFRNEYLTRDKKTVRKDERDLNLPPSRRGRNAPKWSTLDYGYLMRPKLWLLLETAGGDKEQAAFVDQIKARIASENPGGKAKR